MPTITPTLKLTADDVNRILRWGEFAAQADEATGLNAVSLSRELVGRIQEALEEWCKLIYTPAPLEQEAAMAHWELN